MTRIIEGDAGTLHVTLTLTPGKPLTFDPPQVAPIFVWLAHAGEEGRPYPEGPLLKPDLTTRDGVAVLANQALYNVQVRDV